MPQTYGYCQGKTSHHCSQQVLIEQIQRDTNKNIALVWAPDSPYLLPPEELPWLFDAVRALASQAIDNPAHVGGLSTGVIVGIALTRHHQVCIPDTAPRLVTASSILASGVFLATTIWCLVLLLGI
jgi:hypothetical protein